MEQDRLAELAPIAVVELAEIVEIALVQVHQEPVFVQSVGIRLHIGRDRPVFQLNVRNAERG